MNKYLVSRAAKRASVTVTPSDPDDIYIRIGVSALVVFLLVLLGLLIYASPVRSQPKVPAPAKCYANAGVEGPSPRIPVSSCATTVAVFEDAGRGVVCYIAERHGGAVSIACLKTT